MDDLMEYIKGPDFPTGGVILGRSGIREAYRTGRGRIVIRAKTEIESHGQRPRAHHRDGDPLPGEQGAADGENRRAGA